MSCESYPTRCQSCRRLAGLLAELAAATPPIAIDREAVVTAPAAGLDIIGRLTIGLRCSVPAHGESMKMRPATADLVRRVAARIPGLPSDQTAVDDIPEELAALRREAAGNDTALLDLERTPAAGPCGRDG